MANKEIPKGVDRIVLEDEIVRKLRAGARSIEIGGKIFAVLLAIGGIITSIVLADGYRYFDAGIMFAGWGITAVVVFLFWAEANWLALNIRAKASLVENTKVAADTLLYFASAGEE